MRNVVAIAFTFLLFSCPAASEEIVVTDLPAVVKLFKAPSRELGLSEQLTVAIADVESGLRPWVLNIEGQPFRFDSKEKALELAEEAMTAGKSFDVGLMQVNSQWLRRFDIPLEAALDPLANIYFGGWILKQEIARHGDIKTAIGAYHSPTPARASRYADQVMDALERGPQPVKARKPAVKATAAAAGQSVPEAAKQAAPSNSSMMVSSQKSGMAIPASMKASVTASDNSMKVEVKK